MRVTFLGTGIIGSAMARNAASAGLEVRAWNRTIEKAEPLAEEGIGVERDAAAAVKGAEVVVTVLSDADAVLEVMGSAIGQGRGFTWAQMSTIGLAGTESCVELADSAGVAFVDAPVLGTKQPAEAGELTVLASGPPDARERCGPLFDAVGSATHWLGDEPGVSSRMKVALNSWLIGLVEALAESVGLAESLGLDPSKLLEILDGGALDSPYAHIKGGMMIERSFEPSFELRLALKDADLALEAAQRNGLALPVVEAARRQMERAVEAGHGEEDLAATFTALGVGVGPPSRD